MSTKKLLPRVVSIILMAVFVFSIGGGAFALEYDLSQGNIEVSNDAGGQKVTQNTTVTADDAPVITSSTQTSNTIDLTSGGGQTVDVTIRDVDIAAGNGQAGITVNGSANITVEGDNSVTGGRNAAGVEIGTGDAAVIDGSGSLKVQAGNTLGATGTGAGIGGANGEAGGDITITGDVTVDAIGGGEAHYTESGGNHAESSAGIGGGSKGAGGTIVISGSANVTATGGGLDQNKYAETAQSAGGSGENGGHIEISGNADVTAAGGYNAAGIGGSGGMNPNSGSGAVSTIISTTGTVIATGGHYGAGIGGGVRNDGYDVTISNATVIATGGYGAAGIGGGANGGRNDGGIRTTNGGDGGSVTIHSGSVIANGGVGAAGIGGGSGATRKNGSGGAGADITIYGGTLTANGGMGAFGIGPGCDTLVKLGGSVALPSIGTVKQIISRQYNTDNQESFGTLNIYGGNGVLLGSNTLTCVDDPDTAFGTIEQLDPNAFSAAFKSILTWLADIADFIVEGDNSSIRFTWTSVVPAEPEEPEILVIPAIPAIPEELPVVIDEPETPLAETISDEPTPLAQAPGGWALLNLALTVLTVLGCGVELAMGAKERDNSDSGKKRRLSMKLAGIIIAIGAVIFFIATEDMTRSMIITDKWTVLTALIAIVQTAGAVLTAGKGADKSKAKA